MLVLRSVGDVGRACHQHVCLASAIRAISSQGPVGQPHPARRAGDGIAGARSRASYTGVESHHIQRAPACRREAHFTRFVSCGDVTGPEQAFAGTSSAGEFVNQ